MQAPATEPIGGEAADTGPTAVEPSAYRALDSGLGIADLVVGTGDAPVTGQLVRVHYSGWLQSTGERFDSSTGREPIQFQLGTGSVIQGFHQGIDGMRVGGRRQLVVPPELGYGRAGRPPTIPENSTLVFEVELVSVGDIRIPPERPTIDWDAEPGITTLEQGVQVVDVEVGSGRTAQDRSVVSAELTIWKPDGDVYFSSWDRPHAVSWMIDGEGADAAPLRGIEIASRDLAAGAVRVAQLPPGVAWGAAGYREDIPPDATVQVQIEVVDVSVPRVPPPEVVTFDEAALLTTASGLRYVDVVVGTGDAPTQGDWATTEYTGWLTDGTRFDSSYAKRAAFRFPLWQGAIIAGFDEAVAAMRVGGKRVIVVPPDLAYGERSPGGIPPHSTLIFEIELVDVGPP